MKKSLAKNAAFNIAYKMLNVLFSLVSMAYVSRVLSPDGIGKVSFAQNIASYFLIITVFGVSEYGTRETAKRQGDKKEESKLFSELIVLNCLSTIISIAGYFVMIGFFFPENPILHVVFSLELLLNLINIDWFYQGKEEYAYITIRSVVVKAISLLAVVLFVRTESDFVIYALILCLGIGCNHIFNMIHARTRVRFQLRGLNLQQHMKPALALILTTLAAGLYNKADVTMLGWLSTDAAVGYYTNAQKVINVAMTLITAISAVFLPRLSAAYGEDKKQYEAYLTTGMNVVLLISVPSCIGMAAVAKNLAVVMFGAEFLPSATIIQILSVSAIIRGAGNLLCYLAIIGTGQEGKLIVPRVVAGIVNVALNLFLIPKLSCVGAAISYVLSELIVTCMPLRYALSIGKPATTKQFCISLAVSGLIMGVAVLLVQSALKEGALSLVVSVMAGVIVYGIMLFVTKNEVMDYVMTMLRGRKGNNLDKVSVDEIE